MKQPGSLVRLVVLAIVIGMGSPSGRLLAAPKWQTNQSAHFRVLHLGSNATIVRRVLRAAEQQLRRQFKRFGATRSGRAWPGRCDIYLYPSQRDLIQMTGGDLKAGSASSRPSQLYHGKILARRINLSATDRNLFASTLPHEITHIVVNELMGGDVPRWANEGLAVLAEPERVQKRHRQVVARAARQGALYPVETLMSMRSYPPDHGKPLYYAQSMSISAYLVNRKNPYHFLLFLQVAQLYGYKRALWAVYEIDSYEDLTKSWLKAIRAQRT